MLSSLATTSPTCVAFVALPVALQLGLIQLLRGHVVKDALAVSRSSINRCCVHHMYTHIHCMSVHAGLLCTAWHGDGGYY
jgi:hypothetical protein